MKRLFNFLLGLLAAALVTTASGEPNRQRHHEWEPIDMANPVWISTDGDWSNTASWSTGVVPVGGDNIRFDGSSVVDVTAGLNQSAAGLMATVQIKKQYTGALGSSGGFLRIRATKFFNESRGPHFIEADVTINEFQNRAGGTLTLDGTFNSVSNVRGDITFLPAAIINVYAQLEAGATALMPEGMGIAVETVVTGGELTIRDNGPVNPKLVVGGGRVIFDGQSFEGIMYITHPSAEVIWKPTSSGGALDGLYVLDGTFDTKDATIAQSITERVVGPRARVDRNDLLTIVTDIDLREEFF